MYRTRTSRPGTPSPEMVRKFFSHATRSPAAGSARAGRTARHVTAQASTTVRVRDLLRLTGTRDSKVVACGKLRLILNNTRMTGLYYSCRPVLTEPAGQRK